MIMKISELLAETMNYKVDPTTGANVDHAENVIRPDLYWKDGQKPELSGKTPNGEIQDKNNHSPFSGDLETEEAPEEQDVGQYVSVYDKERLLGDPESQSTTEIKGDDKDAVGSTADEIADKAAEKVIAALDRKENQELKLKQAIDTALKDNKISQDLEMIKRLAGVA